MSYSETKVPILLIEDDDRHAEQVKSSLGETYDVVRLTTMDRVELYNYKAVRQDSQIIIVDLVLGTQNSPHEGLDAIRNDLWQLDRTTFFVVFSQYLEENTLPALNKFEPHWVFVIKETAGTDLNEQCLTNLFNIVEHCRECSSPVMTTPQYQLREWVGQLEDYKSPFDPIDSSVVRKNISRSVDILNDLARVAAQYTKAGQQSRQIAIGVFGSCGRLEMRDDSDVECSVYYSGDTNNILASTFWNRITRYISSRGLRYEGQEAIESSPIKFLLPNQIGENILSELPEEVREKLKNRFENKFIPLILKDQFLEVDLDKEPQVRDRHFQILTELRPIFNPNFILQMKKDMVLRHCRTSDVKAMVDSTYMQNIVNQYFMDVQPESLTSWEDIKRFCYRILNVLALQLFFIKRLRFDSPQRLSDAAEWDRLFSSLCDPGVIKVIQFSQACEKTLPDGDAKRELLSEVHQLIEKYFEIYSRFTEADRDERMALKRNARLTIEPFIKVLYLMRGMDYFKPVVTEVSWLFGTERVEELKNRVF